MTSTVVSLTNTVTGWAAGGWTGWAATTIQSVARGWLARMSYKKKTIPTTVQQEADIWYNQPRKLRSLSPLQKLEDEAIERTAQGLNTFVESDDADEFSIEDQPFARSGLPKFGPSFTTRWLAINGVQPDTLVETDNDDGLTIEQHETVTRLIAQFKNDNKLAGTSSGLTAHL
jgi:hypothetical protein